MRHDQLTTGWQVFLFNVTVDEQKNLLYFGLAIIDAGLQQLQMRVYDPDQPAMGYIVQLPGEYLDSLLPIVHLRQSLPFTYEQKTTSISTSKSTTSIH
jgi:hypothetical protein